MKQRKQKQQALLLLLLAASFLELEEYKNSFIFMAAAERAKCAYPHPNQVLVARECYGKIRISDSDTEQAFFSFAYIYSFNFFLRPILFPLLNGAHFLATFRIGRSLLERRSFQTELAKAGLRRQKARRLPFFCALLAVLFFAFQAP